MNSAYKHLDSKLRIGEMTLSQWVSLFVGVMSGLMWAMYLSPFGTTLTLASAVYVAGVPISVVFLANVSEINMWLLIRSAVRWRRLDARYLPGAGAQTAGYRLTEPPEDARRVARENVAELDLASLWGSS